MRFHTVTTGGQETHDSQYKGLIQSKSQKPGKLFKERKYKSHKLFLITIKTQKYIKCLT